MFWMNMFETTIKVYRSLKRFCRAAPTECLDRFLRMIRRLLISVSASCYKCKNLDDRSNLEMSKVHRFDYGSL